MNVGDKDDKNRHCVLLTIDISKHGAKEMGNVKMAGPGFVNDRHFAAHYRLFLN
jgi:hypothetical protein